MEYFGRGVPRETVHSLPANDNCDSLREYNYSRARRERDSPQLIAASGNCRMTGAEVFPAQLDYERSKERIEKVEKDASIRIRLDFVEASRKILWTQ